jgi:hypothetical protein
MWVLAWNRGAVVGCIPISAPYCRGGCYSRPTTLFQSLLGIFKVQQREARNPGRIVHQSKVGTEPLLRYQAETARSETNSVKTQEAHGNGVNGYEFIVFVIDNFGTAFPYLLRSTYGVGTVGRGRV